MTDRPDEPQRERAGGTVGGDGHALGPPPANSMDWLDGPLQLLGGMVRARVKALVVRGLAYVVMAIFGLGLAIYYAANSLYGVTPAALPVLILFTVWFIGTIVALALYVRSEKRRWSASNPRVHEPAAAPPQEAEPLVRPRNRELAPSLGERARNLIPWVGTLLATIPLAALSLLVGALVADPLEAAGVPNSVSFPLGLIAMCSTFAAGTILVFRRLWSRSPVAHKRRAKAEARRVWLRDIDAHLAPPATTKDPPI